MFKTMNTLEWIGVVLLTVGLISLLIHSVTERPDLRQFTEHHQLLHMLGLGTWALGYLQRTRGGKVK